VPVADERGQPALTQRLADHASICLRIGEVRADYWARSPGS
jgi:hypothetical protein